MTLTYGRIAMLVSVLALASCDDDEVSHLRPSIDYSVATAVTPYSELFVDTNGGTTVDLTQGNSRHKMFQALNYYSTSSVSAKTHIEAAKLKSMFSNSGNPFSDISTSTISVVGADLNASDVQLKDIVASSKS